MDTGTGQAALIHRDGSLIRCATAHIAPIARERRRAINEGARALPRIAIVSQEGNLPKDMVLPLSPSRTGEATAETYSPTPDSQPNSQLERKKMEDRETQERE